MIFTHDTALRCHNVPGNWIDNVLTFMGWENVSVYIHAYYVYRCICISVRIHWHTIIRSFNHILVPIAVHLIYTSFVGFIFIICWLVYSALDILPRSVGCYTCKSPLDIRSSIMSWLLTGCNIWRQQKWCTQKGICGSNSHENQTTSPDQSMGLGLCEKDSHVTCKSWGNSFTPTSSPWYIQYIYIYKTSGRNGEMATSINQQWQLTLTAYQ